MTPARFLGHTFARCSSGGFTLVEVLVVMSIIGLIAVAGLNFDFQKKLASEEREAFVESVAELVSTTRMNALIGKGVNVGGEIITPDETRVRMSSGGISILYYSWGTHVATGATYDHPFRWDADFSVGALRVTRRDNTVEEFSDAEFDIVFQGSDMSFTGTSIDFSETVSAELLVGYKGAFQGVTFDNRALATHIEDSCIWGCCQARSGYSQDGYVWNLPALSIWEASDTLLGTKSISNGTQTASRIVTCRPDLTFSGSTISENTPVCNTGYEWSETSESCRPMRCSAASDLIVDGYRWSVPEQQLDTTSMAVTGTKIVSHGTRTATRTFTCTSAWDRVGNAMTEDPVVCDTGYTWDDDTSLCVADDCFADAYTESGYTWNIPLQVSGNESSIIVSEAISITNGTRTAKRRFTCVAGSRIAGDIMENPGTCDSGYVWNTITETCLSGACSANTAYQSQGYAWNVSYQDPNTTSSVLSASRTIENGSRTASARFSCSARWERTIQDFIEDPGTCSEGYIWNSTAAACLASDCSQNVSLVSGGYTFSVPATSSGATTPELVGTQALPNGQRTATRSFSCVQGAFSGSALVENLPVCDAGYAWDEDSGACVGAVCAMQEDYSADGYTWDIPELQNNTTSGIITGTESIANGSRTAVRTFTCINGTLFGNAMTVSPAGDCDSGYEWDYALQSCISE